MSAARVLHCTGTAEQGEEEEVVQDEEKEEAGVTFGRALGVIAAAFAILPQSSMGPTMVFGNDSSFWSIVLSRLT